MTMLLPILALTLALALVCTLHIRRPPPPAAPVLDECEQRRRIAAQQEWLNFLHYRGDAQPPIDVYDAAHHAAHI